MKTYEISIRNSSGKVIRVIVLAPSKKEAVKKYNKGKWKETYRILSIEEL